MEATTAPTTESSTGSRTIADLLPRAAEKHADKTAVRYKRDGEWHGLSYRQVG
jgi:long-subunit acyl-CoA synthetase (AMP-forming)